MIETINRIFGKDNRTYLMGIAILWIVFFHVYLWCRLSGITTTWWIDLFDKGALGVDVFFLLSAYGLQASIEKNRVGRFYLNRVKRLFPVYVLFLLTLFLTFERHCPVDRMAIQSLCQITGLSLFKYPEFFSCGFCFDWFTPAIVFIYISFPLISWIVRKVVEKGIGYEAGLLLLVVIAGVWIRENKHFMFGLLAVRFPIILLGIIAYMHVKRDEVRQLLGMCVLAAFMGLLSGNEEMRLSLLVPPLLVTFSLFRFSLPFHRFVSLVGRHSFEVYLAHIFAVAFFIPTKQVTSIPLLLLITIGTTMLLTFVYSFIQTSFYKISN